MNRQPTINRLDARYGAPMGRPEWLAAPTGPLHLFRVLIDGGGYDRGGAYWGNDRTHNARLYSSDPLFWVFLRAACRYDAQVALLRDHPGVKLRRTSAPPRRLWWSDGSGTLNLSLTLRQAQGASHMGQCDADVAALCDDPVVAEQTRAWAGTRVYEALRDYGYEPEELDDHAANVARLVWIAAGDIADEPERFE
jgi:hypothetical protein